MLVWSLTGRIGAWSLLALVFGLIYVLPLAVIALASFAGQWNSMLPSQLTLDNYAGVIAGESGGQLRVSLITAALASTIALLSGTWAAIALRSVAPAPRRLLDLLFFIPSAVPSVSVGLGLLVAFSSTGGRLNGTSRPRPTETDGTALGTKNSMSSTRRGSRGIVRSASAAQVPATRATRLAIAPVAIEARSCSGRLAREGVAVMQQRQLARQHAVPLAGDRGQRDHRQRHAIDQAEADQQQPQPQARPPLDHTSIVAPAMPARRACDRPRTATATAPR